MARDEAYRRAEKKIEEAFRTGAKDLDLSNMWLIELPESLGQLTQLQTLGASRNKLTALPESLGQLTQLQTLDLSNNQLTELSESLGQLTQLEALDLSCNQLTELSESLGELRRLNRLNISKNQLTTLPTCISAFRSLRSLDLDCNQLSDIPESVGQLTELRTLYLGSRGLGGNPLYELPSCVRKLRKLAKLSVSKCEFTSLPSWVSDFSNLENLILDPNPLNPELAAAYEQGLDAVKDYLRAQGEAEIVLNEAKLILIGEGEVGKTSLLGALRGDEWIENRETTHGVEVKIESFVLTDAKTGTEITFNGWDFGGQNIYRHTHQMFFTAPAVYLAVWNPRRGPEQCCVDEWIKMVKHRAYDETRPDDRPRILVVATHGGPKERSAHIDEQLLRDEFGDLMAGFHHVDSKTGHGLDKLKEAIAREAAAIPTVGRSVPASWKNMLDALRKRGKKDPYLTYKKFRALCRRQKVSNELADLYAAILNELGHLIHYSDDPILQDTVILKPEWLSKAISYVLEDDAAKEGKGLVEHQRLGAIWSDPEREERDRYPEELHPVFIKLMERFDLSYRVAMAKAGAPDTSLIAQLVPGGRPDGWKKDWPDKQPKADAERRQICRIIDAETGRTTEVEGLLYRLIVRLHRYSLGRSDYDKSRHWKTGMILDDDFNGRAFVEDIAGDIHVTVRAAYPDRFLGNVCGEIDWLVNSFWKGLDCRQSVPCESPCKGLHEIRALVETKREGIPKVRCGVCEKFYEIDSLLAAATPKPSFEETLEKIQANVEIIKQGVAAAGADLKKLISLADEEFTALMTALTDPAKEGPRLFSFEPVDQKSWDPRKWVSEKFRLILWCEHARLPLTHPKLDGDEAQVYEIKLTREWVAKAAPYLKFLSGALSLALPVANAGAKLAMNAADYKGIENQLGFGKACAEGFLKGADKVGDWLTSDSGDTDIRTRPARLAEGAELRELHGLLKARDKKSSFGGLARVQNKRREFLWVHPQFVDEY
ncbi:MAG: GTPase SAR1 family protein [Verrucomicrobiales bacterium]|jgi:GTPase SAR1 family protein